MIGGVVRGSAYSFSVSGFGFFGVRVSFLNLAVFFFFVGFALLVRGRRERGREGERRGGEERRNEPLASST